MEAERLSPEQYLGQVAAQLAADFVLAKGLLALGRKDAAGEVMARIRVMKAELDTARAAGMTVAGEAPAAPAAAPAS